MGDLERLKGFCGRYPDVMAIEIDGERWLFASSGYFIAAIKSDEPTEAPTADAEMAATSAELIREARAGGVPVSTQSFAAWAAVQAPCQCKGTGEQNCYHCAGSGIRSHECDDCGHEHECECQECDDGRVTCRKCMDFDAGEIQGTVFDRRKLARGMVLFEGVDTVDVAVRGIDAPMSIRAGSVLFLLMGMRAKATGPAFSLSSEAA